MGHWKLTEIAETTQLGQMPSGGNAEICRWTEGRLARGNRWTGAQRKALVVFTANALQRTKAAALVVLTTRPPSSSPSGFPCRTSHGSFLGTPSGPATIAKSCRRRRCRTCRAGLLRSRSETSSRVSPTCISTRRARGRANLRFRGSAMTWTPSGRLSRDLSAPTRPTNPCQTTRSNSSCTATTRRCRSWMRRWGGCLGCSRRRGCATTRSSSSRATTASRWETTAASGSGPSSSTTPKCRSSFATRGTRRARAAARRASSSSWTSSPPRRPSPARTTTEGSTYTTLTTFLPCTRFSTAPTSRKSSPRRGQCTKRGL
mmetsp:Transcript_61127/g.119903  ORF Transcript_61127/g.119903 Transcript_61127/m.119903 type:complete len:317 (+) Transcript_61127:356-1306(+)